MHSMFSQKKDISELRLAENHGVSLFSEEKVTSAAFQELNREVKDDKLHNNMEIIGDLIMGSQSRGQ